MDEVGLPYCSVIAAEKCRAGSESWEIVVLCICVSLVG